MFLLPYSTDNPTRRLPAVTLVLVAANCAVHAFVLFSGENAFALLDRLAFSPTTATPLAVLTSMFAHIDLFHLLFNMVFLWTFGPNVEDLMGRVPFLAFYLAGGCAALGLQHGMSGDLPYKYLGASGAVSAIMGAYFVLCPKVLVKAWFFLIFFPIRIHVHAFVLLGFFFLRDLFYALEPGGRPTVAFWAHLGGFAFGAGLIFSGIRSKVLVVRNYAQVRKGNWARLAPEEELEQEIDLALSKNDPDRLAKTYVEALLKKPRLAMGPERQIQLARLLTKTDRTDLALKAAEDCLLRHSEGDFAPEAAFLAGKALASMPGREREAAARFALAIRGGGAAVWGFRAKQEIQALNERMRNSST